MRGAGWLVAVLLAVGWFASEVPVRPRVASSGPLSTWRRTAEGWETATWLVADVPARWPSLHPGVVAAMELLLVLTALVAFGPSRVSPSHPASPQRSVPPPHVRPQTEGPGIPQTTPSPSA